MKLVLRTELLPISEYELVRERFRARIIDEKRTRRLSVGDRVVVVFENHDTVLFQVQEMLRTERITNEESIAHELETYNALVPGENELSCTLMISIDDHDERVAFLASALGFESAVSVVINGEAYGATVEVGTEVVRDGTEFAHAVQYIKFPIAPAAADALKSGTCSASFRIAHAAYHAEVALPPALVASLASDLRAST